MRIIAGAAKSKRLVAPDVPTTRPVTDRVREAVFNALGTWVVDAVVADLYAGSGSFGLEALSRGAASARFVESGREAIRALTKNIATVGLGGTIIAQDVEVFLRTNNERFHVVFIDPPWDLSSRMLSDQFALLDTMLEPDAEIIASRRNGDDPPAHPPRWQVLTDRRYGDTRIYRYEKEAV